MQRLWSRGNGLGSFEIFSTVEGADEAEYGCQMDGDIHAGRHVTARDEVRGHYFIP